MTNKALSPKEIVEMVHKKFPDMTEEEIYAACFAPKPEPLPFEPTYEWNPDKHGTGPLTGDY